MRSKQTKLILIVLDSIGVGELPDAGDYGDKGTNTISHVAQEVGGLRLPNLAALGLGNITNINGVSKNKNAIGCFGKMAEASKGKDSTTGHWEIAGIITQHAFPLYPNGFPKKLLEKFLRVTGCNGYLGNKPASGTEIIKELGDEHVRTGFPIVYTSGDSVFQIATHQDVIPLERLYEICQRTREQVVVDQHRVGRVIARPFIGVAGNYMRTPYRRDYAVEPPAETILDVLHASGVPTIGIGKIDDLFNGRGLQEKIHIKSNAEGIEEIIKAGKSMQSGFLMANLVDFDMLYGHRQDAKGYAKALEEFDVKLPEIQECIDDNDVLILTADHGNDPTDQSTDHTREYVPVLCYTKSGKKNVNLGVRSSFADIGKTVAEFFDAANAQALSGQSFLSDIL
ncbi:MAG: phosphopentomutase [Bacteroidota bacterium]|jgi:phosphopentomutase